MPLVELINLISVLDRLLSYLLIQLLVLHIHHPHLVLQLFDLNLLLRNLEKVLFLLFFVLRIFYNKF